MLHFRSLLSHGIIILCLANLAGCKKEELNPELRDPIYKDLLSEKKKYQKKIKEAEEGLESSKRELAISKPRSLEIKVNRREIFKLNKKLVIYRQFLKFYEIRTERRRVETRQSYRIAFKKGLPWPDPKEFEQYSTNKRLSNAPRNWNYRVPKLHARNPNFKEATKKDKQKEEKK